MPVLLSSCYDPRYMIPSVVVVILLYLLLARLGILNTRPTLVLLFDGYA